MLTLRDKFGFTSKQLEDFTGALNTCLEDYLDHRFTANDIADVVKEETGIDIHGMVWRGGKKK